MPISPRLLKKSSFTPKSISGLALWLDASDASSLYTTDAGPVTAVSSPTEISGCVGWYDASDAASITASGGAVSLWNDKSGANRTLRQPTSGSRPSTGTRTIAGKNVLDFDGTNAFLSYVDESGNPIYDLNIATPRAVTVFCVVAADATNAVKDILGIQRTGKNANDSGVYVRRHTNLSGSIEFAAGAGDSTSNDQSTKNNIRGFANATTGPMIVSLTLSASASQYDAQLNGAGQTLTSRFGTLAASGFLSEGSGNHTLDIGVTRNSGNLIATTSRWDGAIGEIVIFNAALSTVDRARVEAYLAAKWGISGVHAPATANNDPVGAWLDKSGNGRHATQATAGVRPLRSTVNGRGSLSFDGTDDSISTLNIPTANDITLFAAWRTGASLASGGVVVDYANTGDPSQPTSATGFLNSAGVQVASTGALLHRTDSTRSGVSVSEGRSSDAGAVSVNTAGISTIACSYGASTTRYGALNGASLSATTRFNGSVWSALTLSGRRAGGTIAVAGPYWPGQLCEVLIYERNLAQPARRRIESYLAAKWGIVLAPQVSNADAQDWINRVYANGGSVTSSTASAVDTFCNAVQQAGLRPLMYRANLFAGTGLNAALVPIYRNYRLFNGRNEIQGEVFSGWTLGSATVASSAAAAPAAAPAGAPLASSFKEATTASATPHTMSVQYTATGAECVVSAYIKPDGRDWVLFSVEDAGGSPFAYAYYNLAGMATGSAFAGATNSTITDAGNGWARISFRCTPTAGTRFIKMFSSAANNSNQTVGDATKGYLIWGFQLEYGTTLTAYDSRPLGNATDTNVGPFVSGDYNETGASAGLAGNGTSKYLNTGLKADALPSADRHLSVTVDAGLLGVGSKYALGADNFGGAGNFFWGIMTSPTAGNMLVRAQAAAANSSSFAVTGKPQITLSGNGSAPAYRNGSLAVTGISGAFTAPALDIYVLGLNRNGSTIDAYGGRVQSYSIGLGMTAAQAAAYYTAMQAFQTALSRA